MLDTEKIVLWAARKIAADAGFSSLESPAGARISLDRLFRQPVPANEIVDLIRASCSSTAMSPI